MGRRKLLKYKLHITPREKEVLNLKICGFADKEVAKELGISYGTVRNHIDRMMMKTQCCSLAQLVAISINEGLLDTDNIMKWG